MVENRRIAMWSGPRNISTAMMRSWGSRSDTIVCDEPLYAHYLNETGYSYHPGYDEIIEHHETDWKKVIKWLTGPLSDGKAVFYQKQMAHHLLSHITLDWTDKLTNVFLIRDPRETLLSLIKVLPNPSIEETGLPQQVALFNRVKQRTGTTPLVLDSKDILLDPARMIKELCRRVEIPFESAMLSWEPGMHETDGIWARHWYSNVVDSTRFAEYQPREGVLDSTHQSLLEKCQELYEKLAIHKLRLPSEIKL